MMNRVDELLGGGEAIDGSQLDQIEMGLKEKLGVRKGLDGELLEIVEEASLEDEIAEADLYKERVYSMLITIQKALATNTVPATAAPAESHFLTESHGVPDIASIPVPDREPLPDIPD